jgi:flagellar motor switch protein FliG
MATRTLSGLEKAAVLLKALPADGVAKVLKHLSARNSGLMSSEMAKVEKWADLESVKSGVLEETISIIESAHAAPAISTSPSVPQLPATPSKPESGHSAAAVDIRIADDHEPEAPILKMKPAEAANPIEALAAQPPDLLALALNDEGARTISLLINRLDIEQASAIYKRLASGKRKEVSMRFAGQPVVSDELLNRIAESVLKKCEILAATSSASLGDDGGPERRMAFMLRNLDRVERTETLAAIESVDAGLAERIKSMLYVFEDILKIEKTSVQKLLAEVDTKSLALSLTGAPKEIQDKIFGNLSKRAQESLKEEIEMAGTVPAAKAKAAQQAITDAIQKLDSRGELIMVD